MVVKTLITAAGLTALFAAGGFFTLDIFLKPRFIFGRNFFVAASVCAIMGVAVVLHTAPALLGEMRANVDRRVDVVYRTFPQAALTTAVPLPLEGVLWNRVEAETVVVGSTGADQIAYSPIGSFYTLGQSKEFLFLVKKPEKDRAPAVHLVPLKSITSLSLTTPR
jgi:hypothetical protein